MAATMTAMPGYPKIPYTASAHDLIQPAMNHPFFPTGRPAREGPLCAEMSRLAYCAFERDPIARQKMKGVLASIDFEVTDANLFATQKAKGFLATSESLAVLAFRGTEVTSATDVLTDINAFQEDWEQGGRVHAGFKEAILQVWPQVEAGLKGVGGDVIFTGHSLGAALATLAASLRLPRALYTIGSPRVGNPEFIQWLEGVAVSRFVDCCDVVCQLPPESLGFEHYGKFFYIDRAGNVLANPDGALVKTDQDTARWDYIEKYSWKIGTAATRDLADHAPINYVSALMGLR